MAANQTQVPVIQTQNADVTQLQQNSNKVLRNLNNQIVSLQSTVDQIQGIGDVILSGLNLTQFQAIHGTDWIISNGQSSVGTAYETLTSLKVVPTVSVSGVTAYIKVN